MENNLENISVEGKAFAIKEFFSRMPNAKTLIKLRDGTELSGTFLHHYEDSQVLAK